VAEEAKLPPPVTAAPGGAVAFSGDATSVLLLSGRERHALPATVPPGSYEIEAVFPKRGQVRAGKLQVVDGTRVKLRCEDMFGRCSVE
jgi:hypothetical protein